MKELNSYWIIVAGSLIVIISYLFNRLASKTNLPSVLLLILLGIIVKLVDKSVGFLENIDLMPLLEILGIIGLIMIVLEAALDLKLSKDKKGLIWSSFALALIGLIINSFLIAWVIKLMWNMDWFVCLLYAIPLAIMSSAIIIPSVSNLVEHKREFMIYESTFSDILGIMAFYFLLEAGHGHETSGELFLGISGNILLTVVISFASSILLIYLFQKIRTGTKFFLMLAILILLYSLGKQLHLSSLLIVLVFGIILSNHDLFRKGFIRKIINKDEIELIFDDFHIVTQESSFIIRTFFFFVFGLSISLTSLFYGRVVLVSLMILAGIFIIRYFITRFLFKSNHYPEWQIAPRGLITILLFYGIPSEYQIEGFQEFKGILLFVILVTSLIMAYGLIQSGKKPKPLMDITDTREDMLGDK
jgi:cell volume regulation protein A